MLSIEDIIELYENGEVNSIKVNWHNQAHNVTGILEPERHCIVLYMKNISDQKELNLTILHEFVHARYNYIMEIDDENKIEVENEAICLYENEPYILEFIKDFYRLDKLKIK